MIPIPDPTGLVEVKMPATFMVRLTPYAEKLGLHRNELARRIVKAVLDKSVVEKVLK